MQNNVTTPEMAANTNTPNTGAAGNNTLRATLGNLFPPSVFENIRNTTIGIHGEGAIGSRMSLALLPWGFKEMRCCDPDKVELRNLMTQLYEENQIGMSKVSALEAILRRKYVNLPTPISMFNQVWDKENVGHQNIMILSTDNIESRREMFASRDRNHTKLIIDIRVGRNRTGQILVVSPNNGGDTYYPNVGEDSADPWQDGCTTNTTDSTLNILVGKGLEAIENFHVGAPNFRHLMYQEGKFIEHADSVAHSVQIGQPGREPHYLNLATA